jgi:hypothetical protein
MPLANGMESMRPWGMADGLAPLLTRTWPRRY